MNAPIPAPLTLAYEGQMFLLQWLHMQVVCGVPVDAEAWRRAYGEAADYQTVVDARRELAKVAAA